MTSYVCPLCSNNRVFTTFAKLFHHITIFHQNQSDFHITCDLKSSCGASYKTYAAFKSHVYRYHTDALFLTRSHDNFNSSFVDNDQQLNKGSTDSINLPNDDTMIDPNDNNGVNSFSNNDETDMADLNEQNINTNPQNLFGSIIGDESSPTSTSDIQRSFTLFILQLREEFCIPKSAVSTITTHFVTILNQTKLLLKQGTIAKTMNNTMTMSSSQSAPEPNSDFIELKIIESIVNEIGNAIQSVTRNEYSFLKYCEQHFNYSPPQEISISNDAEYAYFVPIDKTLRLVLGTQNTVDEIQDKIQVQRLATENDNDLMFSFRDGHFGARVDDDSVMVQLFADEVGLTNPIGAKRDKHKMYMIYFCLEDIPDDHRSRWDYIHLVALCDSKYLKDRMKARRFFEPIINNLNYLQRDGLRINGKLVTFSFSTLVGDNLALHQLCGFQCCFNSGYFCRRCLVRYGEKNLPLSIGKFPIRTSIIHDNMVKDIMKNPEKSPLMGVIGQSPLDGLIGFHPTMSCPGDIMHDYLEGVCPLVIMGLLKEISALHLLTYGEIS